ncbi:hypothetical protein KKD52_14775 [Myxococcota bacterium]|nr:hypothetical protein [Myxococcota bacterium]
MSGDLHDEIRDRLKRRQGRGRIIGDLLRDPNFEHMTPAQVADIIGEVEAEPVPAKKATAVVPVPVEENVLAVVADSSIPTAAIIENASDVFVQQFAPVLVNGALRTTAGGLSEPAAGPKTSVFLGSYQKIGFYKTGKNGRSYFVKGDCAAAVFETVKSRAPIVRIGKSTFLGGQFIDSPGLHAAHGYYCTETIPALDYHGPAKQAVIELYEALFQLFPFVDEDHLVRLFAAVLSPFLLMHINGPCPAFLITAHNPGDGKTLLGKSIALLADGETVVVPWGAGLKFEENLLAALDSDCRVIIVDNVKGELGGATIEALLTTRKIRANLKYEGSRIFDADKIFFITGNNIILTPDMARRVVRIRVDRQGSPQPENMPDLEVLVPQDRARLLGMIKTVLTSWDGSMLPVVGHKSFEQWAGTIGGILSACGACVDPLHLIDPAALAIDHDGDSIRWGDLLDSWFSKLGESTWGATEIIAAAGTSTVKAAIGHYPGDPARALGAALTAMNGRVLCGYRITRERKRIFTTNGDRDMNVYRLRRVVDALTNDCTLSVLSNPYPTRESFGTDHYNGVSHMCIAGPDSTGNNQTNGEF